MCENLCKYLIVIQTKLFGEGCQTMITPCKNLDEVMEIARNEKNICTVYERGGATAKYWKYMCDISTNVFGE